MKTITLNLIKKNRVYFKCTNESGYEVKLKITPDSENLNLGENILLVNDVSIRSKYGVDIIYQVISEVKKDDKPILLKHRYNTDLVEKCRELGGKWDSEYGVWVFPSIVEDKVEELDYMYNSDVVEIEIKFLKDEYGYRGPMIFLGYPLAKATGRDSGARVCDDVSLISGKIYSGGSVKNWSTEVTKDTVFRMKISKNLLSQHETKNYEIKII
jgi:hypothetical protein